MVAGAGERLQRDRLRAIPRRRGPSSNVDVFVQGCDYNSLMQYSFNNGWAPPRLLRTGANLATAGIYWAP